MVTSRRNLINDELSVSRGVDMAETSKPAGAPAPVPPGGGAAERRREFLAAREDPDPDLDTVESGVEQDSEQSEDQPDDPAAG